MGEVLSLMTSVGIQMQILRVQVPPGPLVQVDLNLDSIQTFCRLQKRSKKDIVSLEIVKRRQPGKANQRLTGSDAVLGRGHPPVQNLGW